MTSGLEPSRPPAPLLLRATTVIDGTGGPPRRSAAILVEGGRIAAVGGREIVPPPDAVEVDLGAAAVIPGLIDAHVHLGHDLDLQSELLLRHGVTSVRDTGGPLNTLLERRAAVAEGTARGPRIRCAGPLLDAPPAIHPDITSLVRSEQEACAEVDRLAAEGVDLIKIYSGIEPSVCAAIIARARQHRLPAIGDLGRTKASEAVPAGIQGLEHAQAAYQDLVPDQERVSIARLHEAGAPVWRRELNRSLAVADPHGPRARALVRLLVDSGVYLDPTMVMLERMAHLDDPAVTEAPEVSLMSEPIRHSWLERVEGRRRHWCPEDYAAARAGLRTLVAFTGEALAAGVRILAGSDAPNPFVVPGAGLHRELELLVEVGMTPLRAVATATSVNAEALGIGAEVGTLETGKVADLVVLEADPLEDISNVRRVRAVLQGGCLVAGNLDVETLR